jgi:hypothetical protein
MAMQARAEIVRETSNAEMKPEFRRESSLNAYDSETPASKKVDTFA